MQKRSAIKLPGFEVKEELKPIIEIPISDIKITGKRPKLIKEMSFMVKVLLNYSRLS